MDTVHIGLFLVVLLLIGAGVWAVTIGSWIRRSEMRKPREGSRDNVVHTLPTPKAA